MLRRGVEAGCLCNISIFLRQFDSGRPLILGIIGCKEVLRGVIVYNSFVTPYIIKPQYILGVTPKYQNNSKMLQNSDIS